MTTAPRYIADNPPERLVTKPALKKKRRIIGFDTETYLPPTHGKAVLRGPQKAVCYSFYDVAADETTLLPAWTGEGPRRLLALLLDEDVELVGHKCALFDLPVFVADAQSQGIPGSLDACFEALAAGRVKDTMLAEMLANLALGDVGRRPVSLSECTKRYLGVKIEDKYGPDAWRKRYNELYGVPLDRWPTAARTYAENDAVFSAKIWVEMHRRGRPAYSADLPLQICASFGLGLMAAHGLRVDGDWAAALWDYFAGVVEEHSRALKRLGIMGEDGKISQTTLSGVFEEAWIAQLGHVPAEHRTTKTQAVATNKAARLALGDLYPCVEDAPEAFGVYTKFSRARASMSTWLAPIMDAAEAGHSLHPSYQALLNTGRVSASKPSLMNIPGRLRGDDFERRAVDPNCLVPMQIRGCFVPAPGYVFIACDYTALEMVTLAQVLCNLSGGLTALGKAINAEMDLHSFVASKILNISYEEAIALKKSGDETFGRYRGLSKIVNFSGPVGAAPKTLSGQARESSGIFVEVSEMDRVMRAGAAAWPELAAVYTPAIAAQRQFDGTYMGQCHGPGGVDAWVNRRAKALPWRRRNCDAATVAANMPFQALAADGAKYVLWNLVKACYYERESPIYGARLPLFVHDEFILEIEEERAEVGRAELERLMITGMRVFTPDVEVRVESKILPDRWAK